MFALVLLPTLAFVGVTTFERALRNRVEDAQLADRINRIRQYYFDAAPQVARYLPPPGADIPSAIAAQAGASRPPWYQFVTIAGGLAMVSSVLIGSVLGLADHFTRQRATWRAAAQQSAPTALPASH